MSEVSNETFLKTYVESFPVSNPHVVYHQMIHRLMNDQTAVLPISAGGQMYWLVLQAGAKQAQDHAKEIQHFIGPYCTLSSGDHRLFSPRKSTFHEEGARCFPQGYFMFESTPLSESQIWGMLKRWLMLDERRPSIQSIDMELSTFTLRNLFQEQIATQQWDDAFKTLEILRQGHYVSEENHIFLKLQWFGAQQRWNDVYYSKDFEHVSHLEYVPSRIQQMLLRAYYQINLQVSDGNVDYVSALAQFRLTRFRLGTLLHTYISLHEPHVLRLKAYNAFIENDHVGLQRLYSAANDEITEKLIDFLLSGMETSAEVVQTTSEEKVEQAFQQQRYDDAYHELSKFSFSPFKVKYLCKTATMTDSDEVYQEAKNNWNGLSTEEQERLLKDPSCRADILLILGRMTVVTVPEIDEVTWHVWFSHFNRQQLPLDQLHLLIRKINSTRGGIVWTDEVLESLALQFAELAMMSLTGSARSLLETALSMFLTELTDPEHFPKDQALPVYDYCSELMLVHSKKNTATMTYYQKLSEGMLHLDINMRNTLWKRIMVWFDETESKASLPFLQSGLELFLDYGVHQQELAQVWNHWTGSLGDVLFTVDPVDLESWCELGRLMVGDAHLYGRLIEKLQQQDETTTDILAELPPQKVTVFTLREHTAKRAVERLLRRNPYIKYVICTDSALTNEAKTHAQSADVVVIVTTCLSHAIFYGIQPYLRENVVYPRSSGTSGIISAFEDYAKKLSVKVGT